MLNFVCVCVWKGVGGDAKLKTMIIMSIRIQPSLCNPKEQQQYASQLDQWTLQGHRHSFSRFSHLLHSDALCPGTKEQHYKYLQINFNPSFERKNFTGHISIHRPFSRDVGYCWKHTNMLKIAIQTMDIHITIEI